MNLTRLLELTVLTEFKEDILQQFQQSKNIFPYNRYDKELKIKLDIWLAKLNLWSNFPGKCI